MKPDWDRLIKEFNPTTDVGFVGDVDCTAQGKPLCDKAGVKGYPTIKWGDPNSLEDYSGGRDYDSLLKFSKEKLTVPVCSPGNIDVCPDDKKAEIEKLQEMSSEDLDSKIKEAEKQLEAAEAKFKKKVEKLQKKYEKLQKAKDATIAEIKDSGLGLMKSVRAHGQKAGKDEL